MNNLFPYYTIGHFINQPHKKTEFEITRFEHMPEPEVEEVHKHTFYEILWVDEGESRQTIDYQAYPLGKNSLFFISPGQVHEFEEWQPLKGGTIMFTADFFLLNQHQDKLFELTFLDNIYTEPRLELTSEAFQQIRQTIELIIQEKSRIDADGFILQSLLHILLLQIQRSINAHQQEHLPKRYMVVYKKFIQLLENHFKEAYSVSNYASLLNITESHLNRTVKLVTHKTASEVIRGRSILEAKRLLTFSDYTVTEISDLLGYFDSSYLAKVFKKETGLTPLDFRDTMSEKYRRR